MDHMTDKTHTWMDDLTEIPIPGNFIWKLTTTFATFTILDADASAKQPMK